MPLSATDPYILSEVSVATAGSYDTHGKTVYTGSVSGALCILIAGQSNTANSFPTPYTPTNTTVYQLNLYDGAIYKAVDPLLGCSTFTIAGNFAGRLADKLINSGTASSVLLVPVSIDGTSISQWIGTGLQNRITAALARLTTRGLTPAGIIWGQGESDHGTSQVNYQNAFSSLVATSRTNGYNNPWFIAKQTWIGGVVDATVQAAQLAVVDHSLGIWAGPDAYRLDATNR